MMGESRACHRSPVEAPVLLPQLRRGRLRLSRSRSFHRRVTQYTPPPAHPQPLWRLDGPQDALAPLSARRRIS
jgi:hypothetical protein